MWQRLGADVVMLEALEDFLPAADKQIAKEALRQFERQGLDIRLGARVLEANASERGVAVRYESGGEEQTLVSRATCV